MSKSKRQSLFIIGFSMILVSIVLLYYALSQPRLSEISVDTVIYQSDVSSNEALQEQVTFTEAKSTHTSLSKQTYQGAQSKKTQTEVTVTEKASTADYYEPSYPININTCSAEELKTISGIGDARADAIIQYREYLGGYTSVEQIKNIKGIGDALYEKVSPYLTV